MPNRISLLPLVFLPLLASAGTAPDADWTKSSMSAMELAQRVDNRLHSLKSTSMDYYYQFTLETGKGIFSGMCAVKSQSQYRLEYPLVGTTEEYGMRRQSVIQSGGRVTILTQEPHGKGFSKVTTNAPPKSREPADILNGWYRGNVGYVLSAIGTDQRPLEKLVKVASSNPEYSVKAETRTTPYKKIQLREYRITVERNKTMAKSKGQLFYEIIIGDKYYFPISMSTAKQSRKNLYFTRMFGTRWNQSPAQRFASGDFDRAILHIESRPIK